MLNNAPTIYVCSNTNQNEITDKVITHLNDKIKSHLLVDLNPEYNEFTVSVPLLGELVSEYDNNLGITVSRYGGYPLMMLNRNKYIRACMCLNEWAVRAAVTDYSINVLCLPAFSMVIPDAELTKIIDLFVNVKRNYWHTTKSFLLERL